MSADRFIIAFTGASGARFGLRLLWQMRAQHGQSDLIISPGFLKVLRAEEGLEIDDLDSLHQLLNARYGENASLHQFKFCDYHDIGERAASGSSPYKAMIVSPCSMNTLAAIAHGLSTNLIERAADVSDVYYIILDGYTRADVLKDVFRYDNSPFLNELSKRGFYVAEQSRSNYIRTAVSIPSSLNMNYLNFREEQAGWDSTNYLPLYDLFQNNQTRLLLEEMGFITATVASDYAFTDWQDADIYRYPNAVKVSEFERVYMSITCLGAFYDTELPFTD